jgi:2-methylcitrate dehydratase PrpD
MAPALAALVNGTSGHALDFDDIGLGAGHVTVAIAPAVLAVAEAAGSSGQDFVDAMVVGYEVASRLTRMYQDTRLGPYAAGYHKPSVYSVFGATAAVGRLLELDRLQMSHALGVAASQAGGLRVNFGTMTKPLHAGVANRTAVEAATLAREGFTASAEAIEGRFGWHDVVCRSQGDLGAVLEGLGNGLAIDEGLLYKLYPCCGANHYAIDAVLGLQQGHEFTVDDVDRADVFIEARNLQEVLVYPWPRTGLEGKFSLAFNVAAALVDGAVTIDTFSDENVVRLEKVRDRIHVHPVNDLPQNGARLDIRLTDGRRLEREQLVLRGSLEQPLTWSELVDKFASNVDAVVGPARRENVVGCVQNLDRLPGLSVVTEPLLGAVAR